MDNIHDSSSELAAACRRWALKDPSRLADTRTSDVFRVTRTDGTSAVVKLLKPYGAEERIGADLLRWYGGQGAVNTLDIVGRHILMEWLDGETLGDLVRRGGDAAATDILCDVIARLQQRRKKPVPDSLMPLGTQFLPMLEGDFGFWPEPLRQVGEQARSIADRLLKSTRRTIPLHGDLHHDNVVRGERGWRAIDPKGLLGDPAYEFSNIFRNPAGFEDGSRSPERINGLADRFADRFQMDRRRIVGWAAAHTALSTFWSRDAGDPLEDDLTMLPLLLDACAHR